MFFDPRLEIKGDKTIVTFYLLLLIQMDSDDLDSLFQQLEALGEAVKTLRSKHFFCAFDLSLFSI